LGFRKILLAGFLWASGIPLLFASPAGDSQVKAELISEMQSIRPGSSFWVALHLKMEEGWHTYWKNPGDSGLATSIEWVLPEGFQAEEIQWPFPQKIVQGPMATYGYEGEVYLLIEIKASGSVPAGSRQKIMAKAEWLACKEICVPGKADLVLELPVSEETPKMDGRWTGAFADVRGRMSFETSRWEIQAFDFPEKIVARLKPLSPNCRDLQDLEFFPERPAMIDHFAKQRLEKTRHGYRLSLKKSPISENFPKRLQGILLSRTGWNDTFSGNALKIDVPIKKPAPVRTGKISRADKPMSLRFAVLFAFLGGLILNLMPCVFPVLSLKILNFAAQSGQDRRKIRKHGLVFASGVLVSFWTLAGILIALRAGGEQIGWGFQLQSSGFVVFLACLFFTFGLNLFGVFEIGTSFSGAGGAFDRSSGMANSFLSGVLATVVATPCTAPFMGTALGFALSQPARVSFLIFTFLGLGMSFPYLLLSFFPVFTHFLPKPGKWMVSLKKFLGLLLLATVLWLVWVLGLQKGTAAVAALCLGFLALGIGLWILGRWAVPSNSRWVKVFARLAATVFILAGLALAFWGRNFQGPATERGKQEPSGTKIQWEPFSKERFDTLRKEGEPVFIDFTAAWCLTCQVNERLVLSNPRIARKMKELGITALKADWTSHDAAIARALAEYGRDSVPLYVFYKRGGESAPVILPELITPGIVLKALESTDNRLQTEDQRPKTKDNGPRTTDNRLKTTD